MVDRFYSLFVLNFIVKTEQKGAELNVNFKCVLCVNFALQHY